MSAAAIRRATIEDAATLGLLQVAAWRETYTDLFPQSALAALDADEEAHACGGLLQEAEIDPARATFLLCDEAGEPAGYCACERQRVERLERGGFASDIIALYLLRHVQRQGFGRRLMQAAAAHLLAQGLSSASVWVFRDNPQACRFYEALGGERTGVDGDWTVLGVTPADISFGWRDLRTLRA